MQAIIDGKAVECKTLKAKVKTKIEGVELELTISIGKNKIVVDDGEMETKLEYEALYL